jgi:hypothetical protein
MRGGGIEQGGLNLRREHFLQKISPERLLRDIQASKFHPLQEKGQPYSGMLKLPTANCRLPTAVAVAAYQLII